MQDVNLIPDSELKGSGNKRRSWLVVMGSSIVLIVFLFILAGLFVLFTISARDLQNVRAQRAPIEEQIGKYAKREWLVRSIAAKASEAEKIQKKQPPFRLIVSRLIELQPSGITYSNINLTPPNKVILTGQSTSLSTLDIFLAELTAKDYGRKTFSDIILQSLTRSSSGVYDFSLRFTYVGGN